MKIKDVIAYVDAIKPNAFPDEVKVQWINEVEGFIQTDVMLLDILEVIRYSSPDDHETELLVLPPHSKIYYAYLIAMVDFANGEYDKYANTMVMYNEFLNEYMIWYADHYRPADGMAVAHGYYISAYGIAVDHGFAGTEEQWLETLIGPRGEPFKYTDFTPEQLEALRGPAGETIESITQSDEVQADGTVRHAVTITTTAGQTHTYYLSDGTSVSVESVQESNEDGGENIVTFTDGNTLSVKNGRTGPKGNDYILTEDDKSEIAGLVPREIYTAVYNQTSLAELDEAYSAGKEIRLSVPGGIYAELTRVQTGYTYAFVALDPTPVDENTQNNSRNVTARHYTALGNSSETTWYYRYTQAPRLTGWNPDVLIGTDADGNIAEMEAKTSSLTNDSGFITRLVSDLEHYYKKSETYTQDEVNALVSAIPKFTISVVSALPTSNISATTVYLVGGGSSGDLYTEYIYVNNEWEILGSQKVDLTGYATETWVIGKLGGYATTEQLGEISEQIADLGDKIPSEVGGLTAAQISALDGMFKIASYTEDPTAAYSAFKAAFGIDGGGETEPDEPENPDVPDTPTYTVTNNLTNVTNSNGATTASGYYSATLSAETGYEISVTITMGGVDITASVYTSDGTILIQNVTGDIVITAVAELASSPVLYQLANTPVTCNADLFKDTGLTFGSSSANGYTDAWTIFADLVVSTNQTYAYGVNDGQANTHCLSFKTNGAGTGLIYIGNNSNAQIPANTEKRYRFALTHAAGANKVVTVHKLTDGQVVSTDISASYNNFANSSYAGNLYVGGKSSADFVGAINVFTIYEGVMSAAAIADFLEVA